MPESPPESAPPDAPSLTELRDLVSDATELAGQRQSGHLRAQSPAYKRQWLDRVCATLLLLAKHVSGSLPKETYTDMMSRIRERNFRARQLAAERGEPADETWYKSETRDRDKPRHN